MSKLARKWLGCVATSVSSERAFSTGGNVVAVKRAALTPEMVRHLVMLAQNAKSVIKLDADAPTQEGKPKSEVFLFDIILTILLYSRQRGRRW
jgi:hypothetical protein